MTDPRAAFIRAFAQERARSESAADERRLFDAAYSSAAIRAARASRPVKKWAAISSLNLAAKSMGAEAWATFRLPWAEKSIALYGKHDAAREVSEDSLCVLATKEALLCGPRRTLFATTLLTSYSGQGQANLKCARIEAEMSADVARMHGVDLSIDKFWLWGPGAMADLTTCRVGPDPTGFRVFVMVKDAVDVEILLRMPKPTLRESVRLCLRRGEEPRVFDPFLPVGYEAAVGLDAFGRDVAPRRGSLLASFI